MTIFVVHPRFPSMRFRSTTGILALLATLLANAQQLPYDMRAAGDRYDNLCSACIAAMRNRPKEVQFGLNTFQLLDDPCLKKTWCEECQH